MGLGQREAAARIGVNQFTYGNWETGEAEPMDRHFPGIISFLGYEPWPEPTTLADALTAERRRRGLGVKTAAPFVGVDEGTWLRWERGEWKPMKRTLSKIDAFLGRSCAASFPTDIR